MLLTDEFRQQEQRRERPQRARHRDRRAEREEAPVQERRHQRAEAIARGDDLCDPFFSLTLAAEDYMI